MTYDKRFYGLYAGLCTNVDDPEQSNRIKLKVPQILGDAETNWARPCLPVTSNANHPDHLPHLASEVAALLQAHATHATHSGTITSSSAGTPAHTHTVTISLAHDAHTNNHEGKTPDSTYYLDHPHDTDPNADEKWNDDQETNTTAEHTPHRLVPAVGQRVWVMFIAGDPNFPVWMGVEL